MPLFQIQDKEYPKFVLAPDYCKAVEAWKKAVAAFTDQPLEPIGVLCVCNLDSDVLITKNDSDQPAEPPRVTHTCDVCKVTLTDTQEEFNRLGWLFLKSSQTNKLYPRCPTCQRRQ